MYHTNDPAALRLVARSHSAQSRNRELPAWERAHHEVKLLELKALLKRLCGSDDIATPECLR